MKGVAWVTDERPAGPGRRGFDPGNVRGYGGPVREAPSPYPLPGGERGWRPPSRRLSPRWGGEGKGEVLSPRGKGRGEKGGPPHLASPPTGGRGMKGEGKGEGKGEVLSPTGKGRG